MLDAVQHNPWNDSAYVDFLQREWAGHHEENPGHPAQIARAVGAGWNNPDVKLLDVGCGTGRLFHFFRKTQYFGVDQSAEMVRRCQGIGLDAKQASIYRLGQYHEQYDLVVCNAVIFHIRHWREAIQELWRCVKPGGRMAFSMYWQWSWWRPWDNGPDLHLHEDLETGTARVVPGNRPPAWLIRWTVGGLMDLQKARYAWLGRNLMPSRHRVVIVVADKAKE